ncbi:uncharacterized protein LOC128213444 [Mya arenaria]|uniref:uncharacterized protein LOC128213444 n=1 Tax=Mya arenaria TaxID=6604 RepID=UPI0022E72F2A|nr:uncharacterized protein LOC128213444 [Mya arenaria]XP_052775100.1 uncharacterized protein LOC128213444 [Mya arenaria]XP_052775101.1 uncharacterized protein LOC128213444 [Mya arenaria]
MEAEVELRSKHTNECQQRPRDVKSIIDERNLLHTNRISGDNRGPARYSTVEEIEEPEEFGKCAECVKAVPIFEYDDIDVGDHITISGTVYDHHAIVTQKLGTNQINIIEATNTPAGASSGSFFGGKAFIEETEKTLDFANDRINVVVYQNRKFTKTEVAERAREYYQNQKQTRNFSYNVFRNNCEHFATYCVTDKPFSIQVVKVRMVLKLFLSSGFRGISDERMCNAKLFENHFICSSCNEMNKGLLSVSVKPILSADDVKIGDVIRYTYYLLHHEAVVLKMKGVDRSSVKVSIAHYAFRGFLTYRKIIEEAITIRFDGSCSVLQYQPPRYEVFSPEEVVERAKSRIGEQRFVFLSNDSSHFSRWCKLPRKRSQSRAQLTDILE